MIFCPKVYWWLLSPDSKVNMWGSSMIYSSAICGLCLSLFSLKLPCLLWYQRLKASCTLDKFLVKAVILMLCIIWLVTLLQHKFPIYRSSTHKPNQIQNVTYIHKPQFQTHKPNQLQYSIQTNSISNKNIHSKRLNCKNKQQAVWPCQADESLQNFAQVFVSQS